MFSGARHESDIVDVSEEGGGGGAGIRKLKNVGDTNERSVKPTNKLRIPTEKKRFLPRNTPTRSLTSDSNLVCRREHIASTPGTTLFKGQLNTYFYI